MSTATFAAPTPVDALDSKRRFAETLVARDAARTAMDKVKAAPRAARSGLMSILRTFKLDALAGVIGDAARSLFSALSTRALWARDLIGRALGWRLVAVHVLSDDVHRAKIGRGIVWAYFGLSVGVQRAGRLLARVPFIGARLTRWTTRPVAAADRAITRGIGFVAAQNTKAEGHWMLEWASVISKGALVRRAIFAFVPPSYRFMVWMGYLFVTLFAPARRVIDTVSKDETVEKVVTELRPAKESLQAATARATDHVVDRVLDGKSPYRLHEIEVVVRSTSEKQMLPVYTSESGSRVVKWDGEEYDVVDLGEADGDPIVPTMDPLVLKSVLADEARKAAEAHMSPAPTVATPQHPRDVARALGPQGKKAKAGRTGARPAAAHR